MTIRHNSRSALFRSPFGAVPCNTAVRLSCQVDSCQAQETTCTLRIWVDGEGETLVAMDRGENGLFSTTFTRDEPAIVWYSFIICQADGTEVRIGAPAGAQGGEGVVYSYTEVPSFQLTVYQPRRQRPAWYENGIAYQIFPDRFARDAAWRERTAAECAKPRRGSTKHLIEDWSTPPTHSRNPDGSITSWDFYGGSLKGIEEKLPHLSEMGITAIYLNPIFEAVSNHRYDTANYLHIDPMLGTDEDFRDLCQAAHEHGIGIILDGVFNHTGDDSIYFNRYENYPAPGAWQGGTSPWKDAFNFNEDGTYECWWGLTNMPALNENSPAVRELLLGKDGVIRHWLRMGADGWRLDVADELTDGFIAEIKRAATAEKPDALVLGEVWEDASNKISYGNLRRYLLGDELDAAMNYPFRDMVIGFLTGAEGIDAYRAAETIESQSENYPAEALRCSLNLLSSHDRARIISVLGGMDNPDGIPENERATWRLSGDKLGLAKGRFWLAALMQMTYPGVPCVYYGDEAGLQGATDPGNRSTYPWGHEDLDFEAMIKNAASLRRSMPLLGTASIEARALDADVLMYTRHGAHNEHVSMLINRDSCNTHTVRIPFMGEAATDLISGHTLRADVDGMTTVTLYPLGSAAVYFHSRERLQKPLYHGWGVMCHVTSIPCEGKPGTLGAPARRFVDYLQEMGASYWQVLPLNPTDEHRSPYAGPSAFAGNIDLLEEDCAALQKQYRAFIANDGEHQADFRAFAERASAWLDPYCAFAAVKDVHDGASRHTWEEKLARYDVAILDDPVYRERARFHAFAQYRFDCEWRELKRYANERGIRIIGDIPMYVSDDSADTWSEPEMFQLDAAGLPAEIAGTPPDRFSETGQVWGNPTFRWRHMHDDGYVWWTERLRRSLDLYDEVRLDHFLGFQSYFSIPAGMTGSAGRWIPGPGLELFERIHQKLGPLPFIAEDLGYLTPAVRALKAQCGFPGMDVLEFSDDDPRFSMPDNPANVVYTSTHDTSTLMGWVKSRWFANASENDPELQQTALDMIERAFKSSSPLVMLTLQDVILRGDDARMNVPGTTGGNWSWQATQKELDASIERMKEVAVRCGRALM